MKSFTMWPTPCDVRRAVAATIALLLAVAVSVVNNASAAERIRFRHDNTEQSVAGELLVTAQDGGLLLQSADGALWTVEPKELVEHVTSEEPFQPFTADQAAAQLLKELPAGFQRHSTQHYLVMHNTSKAYAAWTGSLLERLYGAFHNFWSKRGFELNEPKFPLVAIVFADRKSYSDYARRELGDATGSVIGYYSLQSNRVMMFDLTGLEGARRPGDKQTSAAQIGEMLRQPAAERTVATVVHEATHQIAFNCGLHQRYADVPLWLAEGVAMYFETPDLESSRGWRTIGAVNRVRLAGFRQYLTHRPADSLKTLVASDDRLRKTDQANDAYCEAWALNYFLLRQKRTQYQVYLKQIALKKPLVWDKPEERLAAFQAAFGQDLAKLDAEFLRQMSQVK